MQYDVIQCFNCCIGNLQRVQLATWECSVAEIFHYMPCNVLFECFKFFYVWRPCQFTFCKVLICVLKSMCFWIFTKHKPHTLSLWLFARVFYIYHVKRYLCSCACIHLLMWYKLFCVMFLHFTFLKWQWRISSKLSFLSF